MFCLNCGSIRYIGKDFASGPLDSLRYIGNIAISRIVISGFCPIHFTVTFAVAWNTHRYTGNIVMSRIVISGSTVNPIQNEGAREI